MAVASFVVLETLGIKYALTLAILTGFLEIIPYVGPVVAGSLAAGVAFVNGQNRFGLDPTTAALIVIGAYVILRHLEDYFVIPALYNRLTKVHPLVVIFSVLAGGHLFGVLGLILAVPVAATVKVIFEYFLGRRDLST
jgi:predicted PurR-regulated permease PerM